MGYSNLNTYLVLAGVVANTNYSQNMPLYAASELTVTYGDSQLPAILNTDYTLTLNTGDYSTFIFRPLPSLLTKMAANSQANKVQLFRVLPYSTDFDETQANSKAAITREFYRGIQRFQEIDHRVDDTLTASQSAAAAAVSQAAAAASQAAAAGSASAASASAGAAAGSASAAAASAAAAATSAANLATAVAAAAASASAAATSEGAASTSATNAANSATTSTTKAGEASTSASNAAAAATAAGTSATNASNSAATATTKAAEALSSATAAAGSATTADTAATSASGSATTAGTAASTATTKAGEASSSASAAASSASDAATSQGAAAASQTAAAGSATTASTAATTATTAKNDAVTAKTAAEAAKTAAELAYTNTLTAVGALNTAAANLTGGGAGQYLMKNSSTNYDYAWGTPAGASGDMNKATYDPTNKAADAFSMGNMVETSTKKILSDTERTKLTNIPADATNNVGTVTSVALAAPGAGIAVTNNTVGGAASFQLGLQNDLGAVEAMATTGLAARIATSSWIARTMVAPSAGITITNPAGIAGDMTFALADDLAALEALAGTGIARRTGASAWSVGTTVTIAEGGTGQTTAANAFDAIKQAATTAYTGVVELATTAEYQAVTNSNVAVTTAALLAAMSEVTLTDAATITWDMSTGYDFVVTLGGARTLGNPTNVTPGKKGRIRCLQDATGGRTLAVSGNLKTQKGAGITLTGTASAEDCIYYDAISSTKVYLSPTKDWK